MNFVSELKQTITEWNKDSNEDEWLFETFRQHFVGTMSTADAFQAIDDVIEFLIGLPDESTEIEVLETIISLARQSKTTEAPTKLLEKADTIAKQFEKMGDYAHRKMNELFGYYRIKGYY
ncbi:hypothetical protein [Desulfatibacillum aliphaticivorans]|uniref:hypothetical protein n=1 Tax=Desulfatibacillum aliphaticivorans TaxID=218208 RepID=UPI0004837AEB|nr:hypothetical protein [Desulfatibacillum aliphaticivorans]